MTTAAGGTPQTTGRYIVVFADQSDPGPVLGDLAGMTSVARARDFDDQAVDMEQTVGADATVFDALNMAVVRSDDSQTGALQRSVSDAGVPVLAVVPELVHHVMASPDYVTGYRDGVMDLAGRLGGEGAGRGRGGGRDYADTDQLTWGLQAIGLPGGGLTGTGVRVAILDTGFDVEHPDFTGRSVTTRSFVEGETVQDMHGHGTHCIGTACGNTSEQGRRYGVASGAEIYAGKVLADSGSGSDAGILAGINWAVSNECAIVSMSLGTDTREPHPPYTYAGNRALAAGTLIIAAAGNNAERPGNPGFVGSPANSPSIMAVAAVDSALDVAPFSARSLPHEGGQVDLAGPGVDVYSSWPMPTRYRSISGTSMATPHASGVAALWAESSGKRGMELWSTLTMETLRLDLPSVDVGSGLVVVPS